MTRRRTVSIHDYPDHLNPFREEQGECEKGENDSPQCRRFGGRMNGRGSPENRDTTRSVRSPEKSPPVAKPRTHSRKSIDNGVPPQLEDESKFIRQGAKPRKKRKAPPPPVPQAICSQGSDTSLDSSIISSRSDGSIASEHSTADDVKDEICADLSEIQEAPSTTSSEFTETQGSISDLTEPQQEPPDLAPEQEIATPNDNETEDREEDKVNGHNGDWVQFDQPPGEAK